MAQYVSSGDTLVIEQGIGNLKQDANGVFWTDDPNTAYKAQKFAVGEFFVYKETKIPFCGLIENVTIDGEMLHISLRIRGRMRLPCVNAPSPASDPGEAAYWSIPEHGVTSSPSDAVIIGFFATDGYGKETEVILIPGMTHPNA